MTLALASAWTVLEFLIAAQAGAVELDHSVALW